MKCRLAIALCSLIACAVGCSSAGRQRPVVQDEGGTVVSELSFPADQRDVVLPLKADGQLLATMM
jgi:hypothetical protein